MSQNSKAQSSHAHPPLPMMLLIHVTINRFVSPCEMWDGKLALVDEPRETLIRRETDRIA